MSAIGNIRDDAARRRSSPRNLPAFRAVARRRRQPGVHALRLLDEDRRGGARRGSRTRARSTRSGRSTAWPRATTGRTRPTRCCAHMRGAGAARRSQRLRAARLARPRSRVRSRHRRRVPGAARLPRDRHRLVARRWSTRRAAASRRAGLGDRVDVLHARHPRDRSAWRRRTFDAACSNFGPLNCVPTIWPPPRASDRRPAAAGRRPRRLGHRPRLSLGARALPGARRLAARARSASGATRCRCRSKGGTVWTRYYTPARVRADLRRRPGSRRCRCARSGCSSPPPYLRGASPAAIRAWSARCSASRIASAPGRASGVGRSLPDRRCRKP